MPAPPPLDAAIIGGGPAGLRAAEVLAAAGRRVTLFDQKPSVGRKFLVAGKGGLNLTHSEDLAAFTTRYGDDARWHGLLGTFGPADLRAWAHGLGVQTYVGTSGRVFPLGQQAAVLLRRWVARLRSLGVTFQMAHRLEALHRDACHNWTLDLHETRTGELHSVAARTVILALGGASWPQTGSDGKWPVLLQALGVPVAPWHPANCGYELDWDPRVLAAAEGMPIKNIAVTAGIRTVPGELLVTRYGLEGGALYQLGRELRRASPPVLTIDFKPGVSEESLLARLLTGSRAGTWPDISRVWRLGTAASALLEFQDAFPVVADPRFLAHRVKNFPLTLRGPRPINEAISSAGGVEWNALNDTLMFLAHPGLFAAGEMIDWEAPTGGYLLQGCFATGTCAGQGALAFLDAQPL